MVKYTQTIRLNCLSVYDQFVRLALEGLTFNKFTTLMQY